MRYTFIFLLLTTSIVEARMYQWVEPGVETTQLSGKPPAWYRTEAGGPRVFVFDNGRLIDDTGIAVSETVRKKLREDAFIIAEQDRQKVLEKMAKAEQIKNSQNSPDLEQSDNDDEPQTEPDENEVLELLTDALFPEEEQNTVEETKSYDELRQIISDWEAAQSESARQALE